MAVLSTAQQSLLQAAIDLLLKGTARETPLAQDVIERIAKFTDSLAGSTSGLVFEAAKNNPISFLIELVAGVGSPVFSASELLKLRQAANLMLGGSAYETPFAEDVIERLAPVSQSSGFMSQGAFFESVKDRPVSTMLRWALAIGGGGSTAPTVPFSWAPATEVGVWIDANGPNAGNLSVFQSFAEKSSVTSLAFPITGTLTGLAGLANLPALASLDVHGNQLVVLDCTGCNSLVALDCQANAGLVGLIVVGLSHLVQLSCNDCALTSLNLTGCSAMTYIRAENNQLLSVVLCSPIAAGITFVSLDNNLLPATPNGVNEVLVALDPTVNFQAGLGYVVINTLGTNAAPTGAGAVAAGNILANGNTINTN